MVRLYRGFAALSMGKITPARYRIYCFMSSFFASALRCSRT